MKLPDLIARSPEPEPWSEGEKIPWHEEGFSRRMLAEHLTQAHARASRPTQTIDAQVAWIHEEILETRPSRVLDLGCGPGLYVERLCALGHTCVGVDVSPASIAHARSNAERAGAAASFFEEDIRTFEPLEHLPGGEGFDLAMLLFGEANAFRPADLESTLRAAAAGLAPRGLLLLEPHLFDSLREVGTNPPVWYTARAGLFSDNPHLCLHEAFWNEERSVATERWWIVDLACGELTAHAQSAQAYSDDELHRLIERSGFSHIEKRAGIAGPETETTPGLCAVVARRSP